MQPQVQNLLEPPEAGEAGKDPPLEPSESQYLDFRLLAPKTVREHTSFVLSQKKKKDSFYLCRNKIHSFTHLLILHSFIQLTDYLYVPARAEDAG